MGRELFGFDDPAVVAGWAAIDDGVMGGQSASRLRHDAAGHAVFAGEVSLANGGGFASVRSRPQDLGAPGAFAYAVEVRGDGKRYKVALRTDDAFDGVSYQASFVAASGEFTMLRIPVAAFVATFRGRIAVGAPALDPAAVRQAGLMIADRQAGAFELAIRSIRAE
jgi:NADH dehydrogenase [ubiquinone] 1 alpha subcomplex assembly factor 1